MSLRIKLLGSLLIENEDGTPSDIMKWSKGCALLTYLVVTGTPQSRELLADLLWDAATTAQSLQNLRKLLSRMRRWVPELVVTRKQVSYPLDTAVSIDYLTLTTTLVSGSTAKIDETLPLYKGDLLDGLFLNDAPRFNEWLLLEREKLRKQVFTAFRQVCFAYSEQQSWQKGADAARRWLWLDAFDEAALRNLMQMLAADKQIEAALQQYARSRQQLWDELGVEPEQATVTLARQLEKLKAETQTWAPIGTEPLDWPEPDRLAEPGPLPTLSTVPYQRNMDFTGRRESLLYLSQMLLPWPEAGDSYGRTLAITGMGGLGKTQLAVEFCYRYGRYFPGGVFWLNFAIAQNVASEIAAIGGERGLGLFQEANELTLGDQVGRVRKAWQETIPRLLIFDNCEEEKLLAEWLPTTGGCRVIVTSRRARWSREIPIVKWPLSALEPFESVAFLQRLVSGLSTNDAQEIAAELGHLPLALHLAGGFLHRYAQVSAKQYLVQLRAADLFEHPSLQGRGVTYSPTAHELNVARTYAINLEQLDPADEIDFVACELLARAACFAPQELIPRDLLLETVYRDDQDLIQILRAEDGLTRLLTLGFLEAEGKGPVVMHPLLAAFTIRFVEDDQAQLAVENSMMRRLSVRLEQTKFFGALPFSPAHLRHAIKKALVRADAQAARLATVLGRYLRDIGEFDEARLTLEKATKIADDQTRGVAGVLLTRVLESQGYEKAALRGAKQAEKWLRQTTPPNPVWLAQVLNRKGWILFRLAQAEPAQDAAKESQMLGEAANDKQAIADSLNLQGVIAYYLLAEYELAAHNLEQALTIYQELGDRFAEGTILTNLGESARFQGDYSQAKAYYQASVEIVQQVGNKTRELIYKLNLNTAKVALGEYEDAAASLAELINHGPDEWRILSEAFRFLAEAYLGLGKLTLALEAARQALAHGKAADNPFDTGHAWRILGSVAGRLDQAISIDQNKTNGYDAPACFDQSLKIFKDVNLKRDQAFVLWNWAQYELDQGNLDIGRKMWQAARGVFENLKLPLLVIQMDEAVSP